MTVLDLIKAQCRVQGVPEKHAERIEKNSGITEEKDGNIIAAVKSFKENILPAIEDAEKASSDAAKKAVEEYEKKHNLKDGKVIETQKTDEPDLGNLSPEVKAIIEANKKQIEDLKGIVTNIAKTQANSVKIEQVREKMKGKIDEKFIERYAKRVNLDAENIDAEIESQITAFAEDKQAFLNDAVASGNYQPASGGSSVKNDSDIDSYIEQKNKDSRDSEFEGVKI